MGGLLLNIRKTLDHFFPNLSSDIEKVCEDPRRQNSINYTLTEIVLAAVFMYMLRHGSRNSVNEDRKSFNYKKNYKLLFGLKLPHMDTVNEVLERLNEEHLERLRTVLVKYLLDKRVFHNSKLQGKHFTIAIDGTGVFSYDQEPYPNCPHRTSKNGKVSYHQPVLEAKLITSSGFAISIGTEWILNEDGSTKQDCEYKACLRLIAKIKTDYPRLPICLLLDGLYAKHPLICSILEKGWEYVIVWKDKTFYALQDEIFNRRQTGKIASLQKDICHNTNKWTSQNYEYCTDSLDLKGVDLYYIKLIESKHCVTKKDICDTTKFVFMTSLAVTKANIQELIAAGRLRWKIENEGFNTQKNGGYGLQHKMNRKNIRAIKNYYLCIQIAHLIEQLHVKSKQFVKTIDYSIKKVWQYFCSALRLLEHIPIPPPKTKYNYRY